MILDATQTGAPRRLRLLESVRGVLLEQMDGRDGGAARRHAEWFGAYAAIRETPARRGQPAELAALYRERKNLAAAAAFEESPSNAVAAGLGLHAAMASRMPLVTEIVLVRRLEQMVRTLGAEIHGRALVRLVYACLVAGERDEGLSALDRLFSRCGTTPGLRPAALVLRGVHQTLIGGRPAGHLSPGATGRQGACRSEFSDRCVTPSWRLGLARRACRRGSRSACSSPGGGG
jgi:hypothetical protein